MTTLLLQQGPPLSPFPRHILVEANCLCQIPRAAHNLSTQLLVLRVFLLNIGILRSVSKHQTGKTHHVEDFSWFFDGNSYACDDRRSFSKKHHSWIARGWFIGKFMAVFLDTSIHNTWATFKTLTTLHVILIGSWPNPYFMASLLQWISRL